MLVFHTDRRSPKFGELGRDPRVAWHFYAAALKVQIRLRGVGTLHTDDTLADAQWQASRPGSRECYRAALAPGSVWTESACEPDGGDGRDNFAAVSSRVHHIDWLFLRHDGHRRAGFMFDDRQWRGQWIAP